MISTRFRIILLVLVNVCLMLIPKSNLLIFVSFLLIYNIAFWEELLDNIKILLIYIIGLFAFAGILNFFFNDFEYIDLIKESIKLFTIINVSILLLTNINIMELVAFLSKVKIPTKISIAIGVGFRYFSLLIDDINNINFTQKINNYGLTIKSFKQNGFYKSINNFILPLFLSVIRRTENISISISIQDVENRAKNYSFSKPNFLELSLIISTIIIVSYWAIQLKV